MTRAIVGMLVCAAITLLSGCASLPDGQMSQTQKMLLREAAGIAVDHFLADSPGELQRMARIREVAVKLQTATTAVTVAELRIAVEVELQRYNLSVLELSDAHRFLNIMQAVLTDYIGSDKLDPEGLIKVNEFLQMVVDVLPPTPQPNPSTL